MRLLLDTHIWLWWVNQSGELLPKHDALIQEAEELYVSTISCWEVALLNQRQRIRLPVDQQRWFHLAIEQSGIICLPLSQKIAVRAADLSYHHRDPADRFIIATALELNLHLMSFDEQFPTFEEIQLLLLCR
jgi:PIN domain nuclease of toxin-antitoxin system